MLACLLMALAGFLTFGDKTLGNVLNNFPADNTMVNVARLCFGLNMLTTLPLEAFVCREVMLNYYFPGEPFNMHLHLIFSAGLIIGAIVLSVSTCDLGVVFELVGATSACAIAYILPPLCYIKLTSRSWKTYVAMAVVAFGCCVMIISTFQAVGNMINGEHLVPVQDPSRFVLLLVVVADHDVRPQEKEERRSACEEGRGPGSGRQLLTEPIPQTATYVEVVKLQIKIRFHRRAHSTNTGCHRRQSGLLLVCCKT